jgi:hypothetical protein
MGVHDAGDPAHVGFAAFRRFVRAFRPALMLHGHSHAIRNLDVTQSRLYGSRIMNVYPYRVVDLPEVS